MFKHGQISIIVINLLVIFLYIRAGIVFHIAEIWHQVSSLNQLILFLVCLLLSLRFLSYFVSLSETLNGYCHPLLFICGLICFGIFCIFPIVRQMFFSTKPMGMATWVMIFGDIVFSIFCFRYYGEGKIKTVNKKPAQI